MHIKAACGCSIGKIRRNNEDNFYFNEHILPLENHALTQELTCVKSAEEPMIVGIFDGMGGQANGQTASFIAAMTLAEQVSVCQSRFPEEFLKNVIKEMNTSVFEAVKQTKDNMGTTAVMLWIQKEDVYVCNIGDSRAFRYRNGELKQISEDHTDAKLLELKAVTNQKRSLTQYIGIDPYEMELEPYLAHGSVKSGDQFLMCSDGLTDMLTTEEISTVLQSGDSPEYKVHMLITSALQKDARDNTTVIVIEIK